ncbi:MAG: Xaa-Pro peptidase family protein [Desulfobacterales bacterium]|jgi:Xaa-Pro aminopeptidase
MHTVPRQEIHQRIGRFQTQLADRRLDGAFILQNADLYYFSGTIQSAVLFVPAHGEPILMVQKNLKRAEFESSLDNIIPVENKNTVPHILRDFGFNRLERAGLEMDVLPANLYLWFQQSLPQCAWKDISSLIRRLRMVKSDYEIKQIKKSAAVLHTGLTELKNIIREGITELEIDGHLAMIARREGHMGTLRMRGWNQEMTYAHVLAGDSGATVSLLNSPHGGTGNTPAMAQGAGFRKIKRNEPIGVDYGIAINGYIGDQFRTYVVGTLSERLKRAYACSQDILSLLVDKARPGISCAELYEAAAHKAEQDGLADFFMGYGEGQVKFIGHGIGLEIDEYPIIAPRFEGHLENGMVLALEPKFVFPQTGVVGLEDDYVMTAEGLKRLTLTDQSLIQI